MDVVVQITEKTRIQLDPRGLILDDVGVILLIQRRGLLKI